MGKLLANQIRGINSLTAKGVLLLWTLLLSFACIFGSTDANAAPTASNAWTNVYAATATTASVNLTSTTTFTANAGTNRLLLVTVVLESGSAAIGTVTLDATPTFGGVPLTPIDSTFATSSRLHVWMGFLPDGSIPTGAQTVNFQATNNTGAFSGAQIKIGTYTGVDQSTPITASVNRYSSAATSALFPTALSYAADSRTVVASANSTAAITPTYTSTGGGTIGIITGGTNGTGGFGGNIGVSAVNATAGSYTTAAGVNYSGGGTRTSLVAASLKAYVASGDITKPVMTGFTSPASSTSLTITGITMTATDDTGVTGYGITTSATPPLPSVLTSPTPLTSYTATSEGTKVLYAWAKDAAGNVSNVYTSQSCTIVLPPKPIRAANWTSQYGAVAYPAGTVSNYTVPAGGNRLLVVAIAATRTSVGTISVSNVTWGGKPLTLAAGTGALATIWNHSFIYYLKEADIASATGNALTATITGGTAYYNRIYAAVYTGVDQTTPVASSALFESASLVTAVGPFAPALAVDAQQQAVEIINLARSAAGTTNRTVTTWKTGWTTAGQAPTGIVTSGPCQQVYIRDRAVPGSTVSDDSLHTASSANSFKSMAAISIKPAASGLTISTGSTIANKSVYTGDTSVAVDAFNIVAAAADTVTNIQITGSAATTSANVSDIRVYRKVGADTTRYEAGDVLVTSGNFSGNVANLTASEALSAGNVRNYIIVYDIATNAAPSLANTLNGYVSAITATSVSSLVDPLASSATITIYPTTTIGNGTEPPTVRLYKASTATNLDAFTLGHNGTATDDDNISTVTVTLTPPAISGSGQVLSKIALLEVVNAAGTVVYGSMTAATTGDIWNIPTTGLAATSTPTTYYLRISTAANIVPGFYTVGGTITSVVHAKGTSRLINSDTTSQTLTIDVESPVGPTTFTTTTTLPAVQPGGKIELSWNAAADPNIISGDGLHPTTPYIVKRSVAGGTDPAEYCTNGATVPVTLGQLTFQDSGLDEMSAPIYHYRVCAMDVLGNISVGKTASAASSFTDHCDRTPDLTLGTEDPLLPGTIQDQLIKSAGGQPFILQVTNNDIGDCPNVTFNIALVQTSTTGGSCTLCDATDPPPSLADFSTTYPATVLLGKTAGTNPPGSNKTSEAVSIYINGLPTADQIQRFTFKAEVSAAGHGTVTTPATATGILNDMPPIVHNANNMGKYQYGTWGNTYTCATCHSNSTTNIKGVYQIISTHIGKRNVVFTKTSSSVTDYVGVYGNDQRPNKDGSNNICSVCHHRTRQHQYSASKPFGGPNNDSEYESNHHNSHDCVKCHTHNTAFKSIYGVCGDCHGFQGTQYSPVSKGTMARPPTNALGTNPPGYGAHLTHNKAQMACSVCHSNTNHGLALDTWFGDELLEIGFKVNSNTYPGFNPFTSSVGGSFAGTNNLNSPYVWIAGPGTTINLVADYNASCSTYCHGGWPGNAGSNTYPNWVGTGQAACGTCHNATTLTPPVSGSHPMHSGTGATGLGIACIKCHGTYTLDQYTGSKHINGNVEWSLSAAYPGSTYNGAAAGSTNAHAPSSTYSTCTNLYCHSNVQGPGGSGPPTSTAVPLWGDNGEESVTAACGTCHIYPNTIGGHEQHEQPEFSLVCQVCHNNGGRTTPQNHAKGTINFEFIGLGMNTIYSKGNTVTPGTGYGTCSASDCHGRYTRVWGPDSALTLCDKCHGSSTSPRGFYNTRGPDGTLSIYSAAIGVHDIHLQHMNSPRKATFQRFTSFAAGMSCKQCHYNPDGPFSPGHIDSALPAEVPFAHMSSIANKGSAFGYSVYSTPAYSGSATRICSNVWCHGAGMVSNTSKGNYAGTTPAIQRQNPKWDQPILAAGNPCTKCHAMPPQAPNSTYTHWNIGAGRPFIVTECVGCHQHLNNSGTGFINKALHVNGVIDGGCTGCHGDPPTTTGIGSETGLAIPAQNALQLGTAGAHAVHAANVNILKNCYTCHYNYNPVMISDGSGKLEMGFNGFGGKVINGTFTGYTNSVNGPEWVAKSAGVGTTIITKVNGTPGQEANVCSNLYCHGSTITSGTLKTPNWENVGTDAACGTCHGASPADVPFPAQTGAHARHASNSTSLGKLGLALACESCHGPSAASMAHVNGDVTWDLDPNNPKIGSPARYRTLAAGTTGLVAPSASYGTCTNFYCHSGVQGAGGIGAPAPGSYQTLTWGSNPVMTCGSCHANMASDAVGATGSHKGHTITNGYTCGYCHHENGSGSENHADGTIYVNITTSKKGLGYYSFAGRPAGSPAGYGTCSNVICHGAATLAWGTNFPTAHQCHKCHGSKTTAFGTFTSPQVAPGYGTDGIATDGSTAATARRVGAHQRHLASNAITTRVKCSECHVKVTTVTQNNHLNYTTASLTFSGRATANSDPATAGRNASGIVTCSTTWCHTLKYNTGTKMVPVWTDTAYMNETGNTVAECVACHAMPPKGVGITDHESITMNTGDALSTVGTKCNSCHTNVKASPTNASDVFTDNSLHVNGTTEGGSCLGCHSTVKGTRAAVAGQFASQSHHIQGSEGLTTIQCFQCHMEADAGGNATSYHQKTLNASVDLVVWGAGLRGTAYIAYTANGKRAQIAKLNQHCLSCHNSTNAALTPFGIFRTDNYSPEAKLAIPQPKTSILSRYSSTRTVAWSQYKYSSATGGAARFGTNNKAQVTKALSAHGNAVKNQFPQFAATAGGKGDDGFTSLDSAPTTLGNNRNVLCYDCHNSHGSDAAGITSSYSSATGRYKGGLLKSTISGQGGYTVTYKPAARTISYKNYSTTATTVATFNAGASICNDCHNNDTRKVNISRPWSITSTYSSTRAIVGYWSTPYFDNYTVTPVKRTIYKRGSDTINSIKDLRKPMGGHYGSSVNATPAGHKTGTQYDINGLCTPCHDPHGVSNALSTDRHRGVPLLKGTWVTSPYREDKADILVKRGGGSTFAGFNVSGAVPGYHIDQNTFMTTPAPFNGGAATATSSGNKRTQRFRSFSNLSSAQSGTNYPNLAATSFAGLCLECHTQLALTGTASGRPASGATWMSKERVHQSVSGWASSTATGTDNQNNRRHAYTCAKCHAPHVSRLPRLLTTNCLDVRHFGQRVASGSISTTASTAVPANMLQNTITSGRGAGRFPSGGSRYSGAPGSSQNSGGWWFQTNGNTNTQPADTTGGTTINNFGGTNCHNSGTAGGAAYDPTKQIWNKKSRW